jgi:hypothetical protein
MQLSCAFIAVFAASANGYQFIPSRGGRFVEDPASSFEPEGPEEPVVVAPAAIVQVGPRPYYLVDSMKPSFLKDELSKYRLRETHCVSHRVQPAHLSF